MSGARRLNALGRPHHTCSLAFVACIESGEIEAQALLLFESIRRFAGRFADAPIHAYSPRKGRLPSTEACRQMARLQVQHHTEELNRTCVEYGSANRVAAAGHIEANFDYDIVVVLDSDTLFLSEPGALALDPDVDMALRPVDLKGMCSSGNDDPADAYWQRLCGLAGVAIETLPFVRTSVDRLTVRASYNGGLVVCRTRTGILQRWRDLFFASVEDGLQPSPQARGFLSGAGMLDGGAARWWGSNQAALAVAAWSTTRAILELDPSYNYPLHLHSHLRAQGLDLAPTRLVHAHYHWLLSAEHRAQCALLRWGPGLDWRRRHWLKHAVVRCWRSAARP